MKYWGEHDNHYSLRHTVAMALFWGTYYTLHQRTTWHTKLTENYILVLKWLKGTKAGGSNISRTCIFCCDS